MTLVRTHRDSDGIVTGYFVSYSVKNPKIEIWDGEFGDTTDMKSGDWMCDMRPSKNMEGINVIDHHLPHPTDRKYNAILDTVPAGLIAWNNFKEDIPKSEWWKLAISCVGDGQPELIPPEVFEECPKLLTQIKTSSFQNKYTFKWEMRYFPMYKLLSSGINAMLRKKDYENALNLLKFAETPTDIIKSPESIKAKAEVRTEYEKILKSCDSYEFDNLRLVIYSSPYRMAGYVATDMLADADGKCIMAINRQDNHGSLRGELAYYWRNKLKNLPYLVIDGHPGFCGVSMIGNPDILVDDISKL